MRSTDLFVGNNTSFNNKSQTPMVNIVGAGQFGFLPQYQKYLSNAAYVRRPLIALVMQTPRGFNDLPGPKIWHSTFKSIFETHSRTITGLRSTINVEYISNPFGGAGELQQDLSKVTRERSTPTHTVIEKVGKPIKSAMEGYIFNLLADPESGVPAVTSYTNTPNDALPDYVGFTVLYIEPDVYHKTVIEAYLVTNMMPDTAGINESTRDIVSPNEGVEYTYTWTGIQQVGAGVNQLAQRMLSNINLIGLNPNRREAWLQKMDGEVESAPGGIFDGMNLARRQTV